MTPKQLLLSITIFAFANTIQAQEYNPYKEIGKKVKVLTLSKGKYDEFFDYKDIQRIGTVMFNIRTKKIVQLLNADSIFKKFSNNSSASRWYSPDPHAEKYASLSPYSAFANNPINVVDPDGRDIILVVWATANGSFGHAAIGISNYKEVSERVKVNGKWTTQKSMVADGTYSYYELGPGKGASLGLGNFDKDVNAYYGKDGNVSRTELINNKKDGSQISHYDEYQADGIVEIKTGFASDTKTKAALDKIKEDNQPYNGVSNNCTVYATVGVTNATGQAVDATEVIKTDNTKVTTVTPNHLYKAAVKLSGATVVKDPGTLVDKGFIEGKANGGIKQSYVEKHY